MANDTPSGEPETLQTSVELIGPEQAADYMLHNKYNRQISGRRVQNYALMMSKGKWFFTGEAIIFNGEYLEDGAHRLLAIQEAKVTLPFVVVRGVAVEAFKYMNSGAPRNLANSLYIQGKPNPKMLAHATNYLAGFRKTNRWTTSPVQVPDRWETIEMYPELEQITPLYTRRFLPGINKGILIAAHVLFARKDQDQADEFMHRIIDGEAEGGEPLPSDHPSQAYRAWFSSVMAKIPPKPRDINAKIGNGLIRAWNSFRKNESLDRLRPPTITPEIQ